MTRILLALFIVYALGMSVFIANHQFGHIDDLGIGKDIIEAKSVDKSLSFFLEELDYRDSLRGGSSARTLFMNKILRSKVGQQIGQNILENYDIFVIPAKWSYAPVQFIATSVLISGNYSYSLNKFLGRLPSVALFLTAVVVFALFLYKGLKMELQIIAIGVILMSCSNQLLINSGLMYNYMFGFFISVVLLVLLFKDASIGKVELLSFRHILKRNFLFIFFILCSYQFILLVPSYIFSISLYRRLSYKYLFKSSIVVNALIFFIFFIPLFLLRISDLNSITWNAGKDMEFVFSVSYFIDLKQAILFFINNSIEVVGSIASPVVYNSTLYFFFKYTLTILAMIGLYSLWYKQRHRKYRFLLYYILMQFTTFIILVILGKLTFSPSRHVIIYAPIVILLISLGVDQTLGVIRKKSLLISCLSIFILSVDIYDFSAFYEERKDLFDENELLKYSRPQAKPILITANAEPFISNGIRSNFELIDNSILSYSKFKFPVNNSREVYYLSRMPVKMSKSVHLQFNESPIEVDTLLFSIVTNFQIEFNQDFENGKNAIYFYKLKF